MKRLLILGTRGVPATHGGFETLAEELSLYLVNRGWEIGVYCQATPNKSGAYEEKWRGVNRIVIPARSEGSVGSVSYDLQCTLDACRRHTRILVLGYNTAIWNLIFNLCGKPYVLNMDGIEWKRQKWSVMIKAWFWLNERIGAKIGTTLIADHPEIELHLRSIAPRARVAMIPNGAAPILRAPEELLSVLGIKPNKYFITICRIEPENMVLEIVQAFSAEKRNCKLVVLGRMDSNNIPYHRELRAAASADVIFAGAIYIKEFVASLRLHARAYGHGHRVGGTNPSLVESLGAGSAIIAHDNPFNRWTAGDGQFFFKTMDECRSLFDRLDDLTSTVEIVEARRKARDRFEDGLTWDVILSKYEILLHSPEHEPH